MRRGSVLVLFFALMLSAGCSTTEEKVAGPATTKKVAGPAAAKEDMRKKFMPDAVVIYDLQEVDLDRDGRKEIVAIYMIDPHSTGVKVIKVDADQKENVIFKEVYKSSDVKFKMDRDSVMLVVKPQVKPRSGCAAVRGKLYRWDGSAFAMVK
jgi:hypothetical protein